MTTTTPTARSPESTITLALIIPTRNRASLAIRAIQSLLAQSVSNVQVLVSDNSTTPQEVQQLVTFCNGVHDARLVYLRPPEPLPMAEHWDWAIQQALERTAATHVTVHYDRKIGKSDQLHALVDMARRYPDMVITYPVDVARDDAHPIVLWQHPGSGHLYQIETARVLELTVRGMVVEMGQAFPILSNCIVPRAILQGIRERFGDFCISTGPDTCFAYRFCGLYERYLHLDRALGVLYGWHRSTGLGYWGVTKTGDFGDFVSSWKDRPWLDAAPIPGLNLGYNMLYHDYVVVQRAFGDCRLPPIDKDGYLRDLGQGLERISDPDERAQMQAVLEQHGWRSQGAAPGGARQVLKTGIQRVRRRLGGMRRRVARLLARYLGHNHQPVQIVNHLVNGQTFLTVEDAIDYAIGHPLPASDAHLLAPLNPVLIE